jgi:hypothetical protein
MAESSPKTDDKQAKAFDWVRERSKCSLRSIFDTLAGAVKKDVETATQLLQEAHNDKIVFHYTQDRNLITVVRERFDVADQAQSQTRVRFALSASEITVERQQQKQFSILGSFNEKGECKIVVNGQDLEPWKICRMALEDLFFGF